MALLPSSDPPTASDKDCAICHEPLLVPSSNRGLEHSHVIDYVELCCKHHFHWTCILEYSVSSCDSSNRCALCRQSVYDSQGKFIVQVRNEGGLTGRFDFGREINKHCFYKANPGVEREMTFPCLMSQTDFSNAEPSFKKEDPCVGGELDSHVCYEAGQMTAMHMAAVNDDVEGIANKDSKSEDGQTALDVAKEVNWKRVIALLTAEGKLH